MHYVDMPCSLVQQNKMVTLAADVFFVDGTAFLMTMSRWIKFITSEYVPVRTAKSLAKHIDRVVQWCIGSWITNDTAVYSQAHTVRCMMSQPLQIQWLHGCML